MKVHPDPFTRTGLLATSPYDRKPARGERVRHTPRTIVHSILLTRQRDLNLPSQPECIVKVKVAATRCGDAVDGDVPDVRGYTCRDLALDGLLVKVAHGDGRADVHERVVDCVFWREGRKDEELRGTWDWVKLQHPC